jgi:hypothetical protein
MTLEDKETASSVLILAEGRALRKSGKIEESIETLARAVETRMAEEGAEISASLGEYLIEYADCLLCKEESNTQDIFASHGGGAHASDSEDEGTTRRLDSATLDGPPVEEQEEEDALTDLQLAWESFEHARLCVLARVEDDEQKKKDMCFIHCRLGDIQALQDQFSASIADYAESIEYAVSFNQAGRKVAGLLVSLSQTIQAFMTSEEIKKEKFNEIEFIEKFKKLFSLVVAKYACSPLENSGNGVALIARDGFLLANNLLNQVQSADTSLDLKPTIAELSACATDCLNQQSEISLARENNITGVTSSGFARPSGNEATSNIVTVPVKRKDVSGDDDNKPDEPKRSKESNAVIERADKAKLVD